MKKSRKKSRKKSKRKSKRKSVIFYDGSTLGDPITDEIDIYHGLNHGSSTMEESIRFLKAILTDNYLFPQKNFTLDDILFQFLHSIDYVGKTISFKFLQENHKTFATKLQNLCNLKDQLLMLLLEDGCSNIRATLTQIERFIVDGEEINVPDYTAFVRRSANHFHDYYSGYGYQEYIALKFRLNKKDIDDLKKQTYAEHVLYGKGKIGKRHVIMTQPLYMNYLDSIYVNNFDENDRIKIEELVAKHQTSDDPEDMIKIVYKNKIKK